MCKLAQIEKDPVNIDTIICNLIGVFLLFKQACTMSKNKSTDRSQLHYSASNIDLSKKAYI